MKRPCKTIVALLAILLTTTLFAQERILQTRFDSLYNKALGSLATDVRTSVRCFETLSAYVDELTIVQHSWLNYLQMRIKEAANAGASIPGITQPVVPDSLNHADSLQYCARWYLERSMPDNAIRLLMRAIEILPGNTADADHFKIELCEAYR